MDDLLGGGLREYFLDVFGNFADGGIQIAIADRPVPALATLDPARSGSSWPTFSPDQSSVPRRTR